MSVRIIGFDDEVSTPDQEISERRCEWVVGGRHQAPAAAGLRRACKDESLLARCPAASRPARQQAHILEPLLRQQHLPCVPADKGRGRAKPGVRMAAPSGCQPECEFDPGLVGHPFDQGKPAARGKKAACVADR
ncbi:MAG: hypothetical protein C0489_11705, partial [Candidatus Accumulibacter sp.]|nr:hypothetical protein [Accumulibacter sp.]